MVKHTLGSAVHQHLGDHAEQEISEQAVGELKACPIVPVFKNFKTIALEAHITGKVHFIESLHGDLRLSIVLGLILRLMEVEISLNWLSGQLRLLIATAREAGGHSPVRNNQRHCGDEREEDKGLPPTANLAGEVERDSERDTQHDDVAEAV